MLRRTFRLRPRRVRPPLPARADAWPTRQIRIVIPYPPGGPTDISTRIVMEKAGQLLGQPILFDNKGGASGMIGAEYAKTQPTDGYTFLATTIAMMAITRHLQPIPFDPDKDFVTVARMATSWGASRIHPSVPAQTMAEFVAYVKANPGKVNFGSSGLGHHHPALRRDAEPRGRHQDDPRALQGQRAGDPGPAGGQVQVQFDSTCCRISWRAGCAGWRCWPTRAGRISPTSRPCGRPATASRAATAGSASWRRPARSPPIVGRACPRRSPQALQSRQIVLDRLDKGGIKATYLDPAAMRAQHRHREPRCSPTSSSAATSRFNDGQSLSGCITKIRTSSRVT